MVFRIIVVKLVLCFFMRETQGNETLAVPMPTLLLSIFMCKKVTCF